MSKRYLTRSALPGIREPMLYVVLLSVLGAAPASAAVVGTPIPISSATLAAIPVVDGNIDDIIAYLPQVLGANTGTGVAVTSPAGDVCSANNLIIPCATRITCAGNPNAKYFVNGYDLVEETAVYDGVNRTLWLGVRAAGIIGDVDGDGTSGQGFCPGVNILDEPGIGDFEVYAIEIHGNCSQASTITVTVNGPAPGTATADFGSGPVTIPASDWKFVGHDLEVKLSNVDLPPTWYAYYLAGAPRSGLTEDAAEAYTPISCRVPTQNETWGKVKSTYR